MPGVEWVLSPGGLGGAGGGAALAVALSGVHLLAHFRNYHEPVRQRYTVRVVLMVPVYAVDSLLSLLLSKAGPRGAQAAFVVNTCRDVYEAYCLYNFLQLCLCFVGGQAALVYLWQSENREIPSSWLFGTCLMKNVNLDHRFLRLVLLGSLQFVIVKIVLAAALIPLELLGLYAEGEWRLDRAFVYTTVLYNLSIFVALYALMVFYKAAEPYLRPHRPVLKFAIVKALIFATFWQGLVVSVLFQTDTLRSLPGLGSESKSAVAVQAWLICVESAAFALVNLAAFPPSRSKPRKTSVVRSLKHFLAQKDLLVDCSTTLNPGYGNWTSLGQHTTTGLDDGEYGRPDSPPAPLTAAAQATAEVSLEPVTRGSLPGEEATPDARLDGGRLLLGSIPSDGNEANEGGNNLLL